jgi:histidinol-phosphate aminotransferase
MIVSRRAQQLSPYVPGEQPGDRQQYIKLNTNESPYPPSPGVGAALSSFNNEELRLYPDPCAASLRRSIAAHYGLRSEQVFVGNGSDEVLSFAWYAFFDPDSGPVLFPTHSYSFYPVYCDYYEQSFKKVPLSSDYSIDIDAIIRETEKSSCGVVFPNPNAPTGIAVPRKDIEALLLAMGNQKVLIVDEAYVDFGAESSVELISRYDNLLVVHTFSKSRSLAGLRVGYAMGSEQLIKTLTAVKDSFNSYPLDRLSQKLAEAAVQDDHYYREMIQKIIKTREKFTASLQELGWKVLPSKANFIFATLPGVSGEVIYSTLKQNGILVRHFRKPGIDQFVRITIGTEEDMKKLLVSVKKLFQAQ